MRTRLLAVTSVAALAALALPAHAAAKSKTLFFDNAGTNGSTGCTPSYVLQLAEPSGNPCSGLTLAAGGTGAAGKESFLSVKKSIGWKVGSGKLTGTVYVAQYPIVNASVAPSKTAPGYVGAEITISINGVTVGTVKGSGPVAGPDATLPIPVSLTLPAALTGKVVKSVAADVKFTDGQGLTNLAYFGASMSKLVVPTK